MIGVARDIDTFLSRAAARHHCRVGDIHADLRFGIDLGTATIVIAAIDAAGEPAYVDSVRRDVVRDGVVVDFSGAVAAVRELRARATEVLQVVPTSAATAFPPGVRESEARACPYVLEQAGLECHGLVDEVSAAQALLQVQDGVVADIGGGSTGVATYAGGEQQSIGDLPGGGHHLNLILAGALGLDVREAERAKRHAVDGHLATLKPGIERVAHNIGRLIPAGTQGPVHLVGGALMVPGAGSIVQNYLGRPVVEYPHAMLVTPFGIASV